MDAAEAAALPGQGVGDVLEQQSAHLVLAEPVSFGSALATASALNRDGVQQLRDGHQDDALRSFSAARELIDRWDDRASAAPAALQRNWLIVKADTASHLGICYRRLCEFESAILCLQHALTFHKACGSHSRLVAAAHLNLATCFVEARCSFDEAARHAQAAIELGGQLLAAAPEPGSGERGSIEEDCTMLAVAYHKLAEAYEGSRDWSRSFHAYSQVYEVIRRSLGPNHQLTKAFEKSSRCPLRVSAPAVSLTSARQVTTPRRLPSIPRARNAPVMAHERVRSYELSAEVFQKWPPEKTTKDERTWYRMAGRRS